MFTTVLFIINPISGKRAGLKAKSIIEKKIDSNLFSYKIEETQYGGHGTEIAESNKNNFDIIVAIGGDGTINEVAKGLAGCSKVKMGIVPTGSGNGLARHLNIPLKMDEAIEAIFSDKCTAIDTCFINNNFFINVAGSGFDAFVAYLFNSGSGRGLFNYVKITVKEFFRYKPLVYTITSDTESVQKTALSVSFANSSQFGNNAYIAPKANISDGLIDLVIVNKFPIWKTPFLAVRLFNKTLYKSKHIETLQAKQFTIDCNGKNYVHYDGESLELDFPLTVKVSDKKLMVIC